MKFVRRSCQANCMRMNANQGPFLFYSLVATTSWGHLCQIKPEDNVYITLPLYHSAGCMFYRARRGSFFQSFLVQEEGGLTCFFYSVRLAIIGVGQSFMTGSTVVLARKFSVTNFWKDCIAYDVSHFQVHAGLRLLASRSDFKTYPKKRRY